MKRYNIEIVETLSRVIEVDAKDYKSALEKVEEMYDNQEVILDYNDKTDTDFIPYPSQKIKESFELNVDYDKRNQTIWIGYEDGSGTKYPCKTLDDLKSAINTYCSIYINLEKVKPEKDLSMER